MPKRLTDEQRGPLATWIVRQREARAWKQDEMVARLAAVGYGVRADYYRQVEAGKKPGPDFLSALESVFETRYVEPATEPAPAPTTPDLTDLVAILTRMVGEMQRQNDRAGWSQGRLRASTECGPVVMPMQCGGIQR